MKNMQKYNSALEKLKEALHNEKKRSGCLFNNGLDLKGTYITKNK